MAYGTRSGRRAGYQRHDREKKPLRLWPIGILAACTLLAVAARSLLMPEPALSSIGAKAAIAVDVDSGRELVSKNAAERVYPASLTKLMTALLLSKYRTPDQEIRYGGAAALQEPAPGAEAGTLAEKNTRDITGSSARLSPHRRGRYGRHADWISQ